jgi:hypothetical protein
MPWVHACKNLNAGSPAPALVLVYTHMLVTDAQDYTCMSYHCDPVCSDLDEVPGTPVKETVRPIGRRSPKYGLSFSKPWSMSSISEH